MKISLSVTLIICACFLLLTAQSFAQSWEKNYGGAFAENGNAVQQTRDSGYIITGIVERAGGSVTDDVYLLKLNANGDTVWTKTFGGNNRDIGYSVQQTTDGGYIVGGQSTSFGNGSEDIYLVKTDSNGNVIWSKVFGSTESDFVASAIQTKDGGYCIAGSTGNVMGGKTDVWLIKTNSDGDTLWTKKIGRSNDDFAYSLQQTFDGGFIISGATYNAGTSLYDVYLIRTNDTGDTLWTKAFNGSGHSYGNSVKQTSDSGYIVGGTASENYLALRVDANGNKLWSRELDEGGSDRCFSIIQTSDKGFVMAGYSYNSLSNYSADVLIVKIDKDGNRLWAKRFGGPDWDDAAMIQPTAGGGFIIVGNTLSYGTGVDIYLIKTECNNFPSVTISTTDSLFYCQGDVVSTNLVANSATAATYKWIKDDTDFVGSSLPNYTVTQAGTYKDSVADAFGCTNISNSITVYVSAYPMKLTITQDGNTLKAGDFFVNYQWYLNDTLIPNATSSNLVITKSGKYKVVTGYKCQTPSDEFDAVVNGVPTISEQTSVAVYPNPFSDAAILEVKNLNTLSQTMHLNLYDLLGKEVLSFNVNSETTRIERGNLVDGMYFYKLIDGKETVTDGKLIIQ